MAFKKRISRSTNAIWNSAPVPYGQSYTKAVEHAVTNEAGQTVAVILSIGSSQDIVDAIEADQNSKVNGVDDA